MDWARQRELLPHYAAVVVLTVLLLGGARALLGQVEPWVDLLGVVVVVLTYPSVVRFLGVAPSGWDDR